MPAADKLIDGYQRFREGYYQDNKEHLSKLAKEGQFPKICIVSCSDSRVEPTIILDCDPGDLFVIRNVANLVPPCEDDSSFHGTSAALEYAVTALKVESIIVLGHTQCGGIKALVDSEGKQVDNSFISKWVMQLDNVREEVVKNHANAEKTEHYDCCELKGIQQSLKNLMTFPWVKERVEAGELKLHGWRYNLANSELCVLDEQSGRFSPVN